MARGQGRNRRLKEGLDRINRAYLETVALEANKVAFPILHLARFGGGEAYLIGIKVNAKPVALCVNEANIASIEPGAVPVLSISTPFRDSETIDRMLTTFKALPANIDADYARAWAALAMCSQLSILVPYPHQEHLWPKDGTSQIMASLYFE